MNEKWIQQYIEHLKFGKFEEMLKMKEGNFPQSFYKYRALDSRTFECLEKDYLWMAEFDKLNDTFECSLSLDNDSMLRDLFTRTEIVQKFTNSGYSLDEIKEIAVSPTPYATYKLIAGHKGYKLPFTEKQQLERIADAWKNDESLRNKSIRICSFSTINDSLLMWAHYADEYRGICIEYDLYSFDHIRPFLQPVFYSDRRPCITSFKELNSYFHVVASITKALEWQYESEWRLTYFTESQIAKGNRLTVPTATKIYLGPSFHKNNAKDQERLFEITSDKKIQIVQMSTHENEYKLVSDENLH